MCANAILSRNVGANWQFMSGRASRRLHVRMQAEPVAAFCSEAQTPRSAGHWIRVAVRPGEEGKANVTGHSGEPRSSLKVRISLFGVSSDVPPIITSRTGLRYPGLQQQHGTLPASVPRGIFCSTWHLPALPTNGKGREGGKFRSFR